MLDHNQRNQKIKHGTAIGYSGGKRLKSIISQTTDVISDPKKNSFLIAPSRTEPLNAIKMQQTFYGNISKSVHKNVYSKMNKNPNEKKKKQRETLSTPYFGYISNSLLFAHECTVERCKL